MNNEELKKKICDIIAPYVSAYGDDERIADALIAAGIGDVSNIIRLAADNALLDIVIVIHEAEVRSMEKRVKDAEHRAEVAERALENACVVILSSRNGDQPRRLRAYYKAYLDAAEKELAENGKNEQD